MTDDLARIVREAVDAALAERLPPAPPPAPEPDPPPEPRPHRVKVRGHAVATDCPDCTRGLRSRGDDLVCMTLPPDVQVKGSGGIVGCGVRTDG